MGQHAWYGNTKERTTQWLIAICCQRSRYLYRRILLTPCTFFDSGLLVNDCRELTLRVTLWSAYIYICLYTRTPLQPTSVCIHHHDCIGFHMFSIYTWANIPQVEVEHGEMIRSQPHWKHLIKLRQLEKWPLAMTHNAYSWRLAVPGHIAGMDQIVTQWAQLPAASLSPSFILGKSSYCGHDLCQNIPALEKYYFCSEYSLRDALTC